MTYRADEESADSPATLDAEEETKETWGKTRKEDEKKESR